MRTPATANSKRAAHVAAGLRVGRVQNPERKRAGQERHTERNRRANLALRPATAGDLVPLNFFFDTALRQDYFLRRGQIEDMLNSDYHRVLVAEIDTILVGIAVTTRGTRLVNVLVHPAYRGIGIGKALVAGSGATEVRAKIDMSTGDPRAFYRALGFKTTKKLNAKGNIELMRRPDRPSRKHRRAVQAG